MMKSCWKAASCSVLALSVVIGPQAHAQDGVVEEIIVSATKRAQTLQDVPIAVSAFSAEQLENSGVTDLRELTQLSPSLFLSSTSSEVAGATARIRGIGTTGDNPGLESAVGIFIDGVYRNRTNVGLSELGAVQQVEILRGPQGTLFGRNASAGLINITTKKPSYDFTGYGEVSYGNYDFVRIAGGLSGPIVEDKVAARIDGVFMRRDGFIDDKVTGEDLNDRDRYLLRGQLQIDPTEDFSIRLIADYTDRDETCCAPVILQPGPTVGLIQLLGGEVASGGTPDDPDPYSRRSATSVGRTYQQEVEEYGLSAEINWDVSFGQITAISAYRNWEAFRSQDSDFTSLDIVYRDTDGQRQEFETFSQELRVNGEWGKLDWLVGFYYADEDLAYDDAVRLGADYQAYIDGLVGSPGLFQLIGAGGNPLGVPTAPAFGEGQGVVSDRFRQNSENFAFFTHNILEITDQLDLTVGLRYTNETKRLESSFETDNPVCTVPFLQTVGGFAALGAFDLTSAGSIASLACLPFFQPFADGQYASKRDEEELTGTAALNYVWNDNLSSYFSYSRGYKAGGFNLDRAALPNGALAVLQNTLNAFGFPVPAIPATAIDISDLQFEEETVNSYEFGTKFRSDDRRLNLNATVYYAKFDDFQLNTFNGIAFIVENLPEVESYGFEFEGSWQATDHLSFNTGVTYAKAEYADDLGDNPLFTPPAPDNPLTLGDEALGGSLFQLPGQQITNAPKWSFTGSSTYEHELGSDLLGFLHLDFRYTSKLNTGSDLDREKFQEGVFLLNGRVGLGNVDRNWRIEVFARNVFDKDYFQVASDAPLQGSGTVGNTIIRTTQTFAGFLAEPRTFGVTLRGEF